MTDPRAIATLRRLFPDADVDDANGVKGDYAIDLPHGTGLLGVEIDALDRMDFRIEMVSVHRNEPGGRSHPAVMVTDEREEGGV